MYGALPYADDIVLLAESVEQCLKIGLEEEEQEETGSGAASRSQIGEQNWDTGVKRWRSKVL